MLYRLFFILAMIGPITLCAQTDSLDWGTYRNQVVQFHPTLLNAALAKERVAAQLFAAKGGFDLKTFADYEAKHFDKKTYFRYLETGVKLPTWYGLEFKAAYNRADGQFISTEKTLPEAGQAVLGVEWTAMRGLLMDERRATLKIARAMADLGQLEQQAAWNELAYQSAKHYIEWALANTQSQVIDASVVQTRLRHEGLRESFFQGEKPSIDTLETFIQLQTREVDLSLAQLDRRNALQQMQLFNWGSQRPTQLSLANVNKVTRLEQLAFAQNNLSQQPVDALVSQALQQHPELAIYRIKGQTLDIERRLKREELKPMLNLNYNILGNGWAFFPTGTENGPTVLANDIKWGVNFSMPIPNRKARGGVQLATLKIVQNDLYLAQKRQEIENKVRQYHNDLVALRRQLDLLRSMTDNYRRLLEAETEKFGLGESTVFLLNTREQKWLDAQLKYNKLLSEYLKAEVGLLWAMGLN